MLSAPMAPKPKVASLVETKPFRADDFIDLPQSSGPVSVLVHDGSWRYGWVAGEAAPGGEAGHETTSGAGGR